MAWQIDLSDAEIREFIFSDLGWWYANGTPPVGPGVELSPGHWPLGDDSWHNVRCLGPKPAGLPALLLRNAHVDEFQDSVNAWPPWVDLEGFQYKHLGGQIGVGGRIYAGDWSVNGSICSLGTEPIAANPIRN